MGACATSRFSGIEGIRWLPDAPTGVGALVLAGSSGRVDVTRCEHNGVVAESLRWFGGTGQPDGPWDIPLELFLDRVDGLVEGCDRVLVFGTSFGSEAALLTGALHSEVDAVVAFAPSDVVWAGVRADGSITSHWTLDSVPLPFVPFDDTWEIRTQCRRSSGFTRRVENGGFPIAWRRPPFR